MAFFDNNKQITGDLKLVCDRPYLSPGNQPIVIAGCDICNQFQNCCTKCCDPGVKGCNPYFYVPDLEPMWELGFSRGSRGYFALGINNWFPNE